MVSSDSFRKFRSMKPTEELAGRENDLSDVFSELAFISKIIAGDNLDWCQLLHGTDSSSMKPNDMVGSLIVSVQRWLQLGKF